MHIYHEDDLLQLSKICGITGLFSKNLSSQLIQALKKSQCTYTLFGFRNQEDFALWEYLLSYRKKHPQMRLVLIYNPNKTSLLPPSCQAKFDILLDQVDIVYHSIYSLQDIPMEIAILCRDLIILNHQQEQNFLRALELINFNDPIIKL